MLGEGRNTAVASIARWLEVNPGLPERQQQIAGVFAAAAGTLLNRLKDGPELTAGLRKLVEAKDCFVRQSLADEDPATWSKT